jgi:hypothetical protein
MIKRFIATATAAVGIGFIPLFTATPAHADGLQPCSDPSDSSYTCKGCLILNRNLSPSLAAYKCTHWFNVPCSQSKSIGVYVPQGCDPAMPMDP